MRVIIATGGTGGHIYPAISLVEALKDKGLDDVLFIGSSNRMEADEIPEKGYKFIGLNVIGTNGNIFNKLKSLYLLVKAKFACIKILKDFKPDIVIGFGNYISVPVILAAKALHIKTMIHEQNSIAGKANLFLAKKADAIVGSYNENLSQFNKQKTKILGNPRASEAIKVEKDSTILKKFGFNENKPLVVIVMGSLGSSSVNKILMEYANTYENKDYQVLIVTGNKDFDNFIIKDSKNIKKVNYIDGLKIMALADLMVIRSGATTCAEVCALKKASITIPSPYVPNNHQMINAKTLEKVNATKIISEKELSARVLNDNINMIMQDDELRNQMAINAGKLGKVNASNDIIKWIEEIII